MPRIKSSEPLGSVAGALHKVSDAELRLTLHSPGSAGEGTGLVCSPSSHSSAIVAYSNSCIYGSTEHTVCTVEN